MAASFSLEELAVLTGSQVLGDASHRITNVAPLDLAKDGELSFLTNPRYIQTARNSQASAILTTNEIAGFKKNLLISKNPYAALAKIMQIFFPSESMQKGIHPQAWVHPSAHLGAGVSVGPGVTVEMDVFIGSRSILYPGVYIGSKTRIGEDCRIYPNVTIREHCELGDRVILQPGVVVGSDGFGFAKDGEAYLKIPQIGNVIIEDDVEVGANTCIDRAAFGSTRIAKGVKLDNLIQVAHNVVIGENSVIAAQTGIAGSTQIGKRALMGGQVGIAGHLKIPDDVTLGTRTGVSRSIPKPGTYWGTPLAIPIADEMKNVAVYQDLSQWSKRILALEKAVESMRGDDTDE